MIAGFDPCADCCGRGVTLITTPSPFSAFSIACLTDSASSTISWIWKSIIFSPFVGCLPDGENRSLSALVNGIPAFRLSRILLHPEHPDKSLPHIASIPRAIGLANLSIASPRLTECLVLSASVVERDLHRLRQPLLPPQVWTPPDLAYPHLFLSAL